MRNLLRSAGAALFALSSFVAPIGAQPATGTLAGTVATSDGARLPHATLVLVDRVSAREIRGTSDSLGAFVLDRVPPGAYTLRVDFPGLAPRVIEDVVLAAGDDARVTVTLDPMAVRETVTVSGAIPRESVEATQVRESPARDVGELLADESGLWKLRKGGIASDVVLRGLQSRDLNVLIDGQRVYGACPNHMDPPAFHVDFSEVERVDVGKGPFDVRHQGSLGGVVNVVTRRPDTGWHATTSLGVGSYGFVNPSLTASYGGPRVSALAGSSYRQSAPYRDGRGHAFTEGVNYRAGAADSDAFRAATLWGRMAWTPADGHQMEATYTRQRTDHTLYPYLQMDAVFDNADRAAVNYQAPAGGALAGLKAQVSWAVVDHWMTDAYRVSSATAPRGYSMGTDATTLTAGGRVEAVVGRTTVGGEAYRRNWNTETSMAMAAYAPQYSIPDVNIDAVGAFVEHARPLGTRVSLDLGGRLDRVVSAADAAKANLALFTAYHATDTTSRTDILPSGRVKLSWQAGAAVTMAASLGHTARVAEANERYFALRRTGSDWVGNPDLAPSRNTGVDLSMTVQRPRATVTANAYMNRIDDYVAVSMARRLSMVPGVMNAAARSYVNVDARQRGLEASGSVTVRRPLSLSGDVSYVRGTMTPRADLGVTSRDLAETPPLRVRLRARVDDGRLFAELEGVGSARQSRVDASLGEAPTPAYAVANLTAGLRRGRVSVAAGVANLFDAYYVEHLSFQRDPFRSGIRVAEPGRNLFLNASWKF
ncbi:MAG: TonB-dependent receptor [Vicinamibacterales bacterium]